jgi:hypothetical protein
MSPEPPESAESSAFSSLQASSAAAAAASPSPEPALPPPVPAAEPGERGDFGSPGDNLVLVFGVAVTRAPAFGRLGVATTRDAELEPTKRFFSTEAAEAGLDGDVRRDWDAEDARRDCDAEEIGFRGVIVAAPAVPRFLTDLPPDRTGLATPPDDRGGVLEVIPARNQAAMILHLLRLF